MSGAVVKRVSRKGRGRRRNAPMAEINVTPFVDVMLVLLVIFMVAAPLMTAGVPLNLPQTAATAVPTEPVVQLPPPSVFPDDPNLKLDFGDGAALPLRSVYVPNGRIRR